MAHADLDLAGLAEIERIAARHVDRITGLVEADAHRLCPVDTGDLNDSIGSHPVAPLHNRVTVGTDYWDTVEYGSPPHEIRSHGPWPLRNAETGQVFGQKVNHPGTPEQAFMRPAVYQTRGLAP